MATIASENLSTTVVRDLLRDGLRSAADDSSYPLDDPAGSDRPDASKFVLTSFPDRKIYYPLIVVEEADDNSTKVDMQNPVHQHTYTVKITIYSKTNTHLFQIRDQIRQFIEADYMDLSDSGFAEPTIESSTSASWESNPEVKQWEMMISGLVYTESTYGT